MNATSGSSSPRKIAAASACFQVMVAEASAAFPGVDRHDPPARDLDAELHLAARGCRETTNCDDRVSPGDLGQGRACGDQVGEPVVGQEVAHRRCLQRASATARTPANRSSSPSGASTASAPARSRPTDARAGPPPSGRPNQNRDSGSTWVRWASSAPTRASYHSLTSTRVVTTSSVEGRVNQPSSYGESMPSSRYLACSASMRARRPGGVVQLQRLPRRPEVGAMGRIGGPVERRDADLVDPDVVGVAVALLIVGVGHDDLRSVDAGSAAPADRRPRRGRRGRRSRGGRSPANRPCRNRGTRASRRRRSR